MFFPKTSIKTHGFTGSEMLLIEATSPYSAAYKLGEETRELTLKLLAKKLRRHKEKTLKKTLEEYKQIEKLVKKGSFKVGKVDFGKRYLDCLKGYALGTKISLAEAAFLQKEVETGCQTMV